MLTVVVVIHLMIAVGMISLILLQKTEGNAAGGGFSVSSVTSMMQPRARANPLSFMTTVLGISFFVTSIGLALLARQTAPPPSLLSNPAGISSGKAPRVDEIQTPAAPTNSAPAATAPGAAPATPQAAAPAPKATPAAPPPAAPMVPKN